MIQKNILVDGEMIHMNDVSDKRLEELQSKLEQEEERIRKEIDLILDNE